jgi:hypothetical protein
MSAFYWKDLEDPATGAWQGLLLHCQKPGRRAPAMRLLSGGQNRLQWVASGQTLFWATQAPALAGLWLVRTLADLPRPAMPVAPIGSAQVERGKTWTGDLWFKNWSRFFADQLRQRPGSFLHNGQWLMRGLRSPAAGLPPPSPGSMDPESLGALIDHWRHEIWGDASYLRLPEWGFRGKGLADSLTPAPVQWFDWWEHNDDGLIALRQPRDDEGRVRWWRKKAREQALPPILALWVSGLAACIIVDGHCRLRAALLEGVAPDIITIALHGRQFPLAPRDPAAQERLIASLAAEQRRRGARFMSVDQLNQVLIAAFNDIPFLHAGSSHAWARLEEKRWRAEVREHLTRTGRAEYLEDILERKEGQAE